MRRWGPWSLCDSGSSQAGRSGRRWDSAVCTPLTKSFFVSKRDEERLSNMKKYVNLLGIIMWWMSPPVWHWSPSQPVEHWHMFGPKHSPPFLHFCRQTAAAKKQKYIRMWQPGKGKTFFVHLIKLIKHFTMKSAMFCYLGSILKFPKIFWAAERMTNQSLLRWEDGAPARLTSDRSRKFLPASNLWRL